MSSLVSDFIINPVIRQARRLSEISRSTLGGDNDSTASEPAASVTPPLTASPAPLPEDLLEMESGEEDNHSMPSPARPLSSSTESTSVEVPFTDEWSDERFPRARMPRSGSPLPEDDGMGALRRRLLEIQARDLSPEEKARLMHQTLMAGYRRSRAASRAGDVVGTVTPKRTSTSHLPLPASTPLQPTAPTAPTRDSMLSIGSLDALKFWQNSAPGETAAVNESFNLSPEDIKPTYATIRARKQSSVADSNAEPAKSEREAPQQVLGCQHYRRNVKLQCSTCLKWYTCRFCHDSAEDHTLVRRETKNMLCMLCGTPQRASDACVGCGVTAARYYCNICKLWDDHPDKSIYHCSDCGICRRGRGLGKDFFHCKKCQACITMSIESSHKCIERSTDCDCPICGDYMFTSPMPVVFMQCGHSIHKRCYDEYIKTSYKCPICQKSLCNMETQFRQLELAIQAQPMPPELRDTKAIILCNDCSAKSTVPYHWVGLKCAVCRSFNTVQLQMVNGLLSQALAEEAERRALIEGDAPAVPTMPTEGASPSSLPTGSGGALPIRGHRRHSSMGLDVAHVAPSRLARSLSPQIMSEDHTTTEEEEDSDEDMFELLGRAALTISNALSGSEESSEEGDDDGSEDDDDDEDEDDDDALPDDVDDEDDFFLIGHR